MWFGLWRYWLSNKGELIVFSLSIGTVITLLAFLATFAIEGNWEKHKNMYSFGSTSQTGVLSRTNLNTAKLLNKQPDIKSKTSWYADALLVEINSELTEKAVVFTEHSYLTVLKPQFVKKKHSFTCDLTTCSLIGAAVSEDIYSSLTDKSSISINNQVVPITAVFKSSSLTFPNRALAEVILDIEYFHKISSFADTLSYLKNASATGASTQEIAKYIPIFRTVVHVSPNVDLNVLTRKLNQSFEKYNENQNNLDKIFTLQGSSSTNIGLIKGWFFDQQSQQKAQLQNMMFIFVCCLLTFVLLTTLLSTISRLKLLREQERNIRFSLGSSKLNIFINDYLFLTPCFIGAIVISIAILFLSWTTLVKLSSEVIRFQQLSLPFTLAIYSLLFISLTFIFPLLINLKTLFSGVSGNKVSLTKNTILKSKLLSIIQYSLAVFIVFAFSIIFINWLTLTTGALSSLNSSAKVITLSKTSNQAIGSKWQSLVHKLQAQEPNLGLLGTLPGDRRLKHVNLLTENFDCSPSIKGWENIFYGKGLANILAEKPVTNKLGNHDLVVSKSILSACNWDQSTDNKFININNAKNYKVITAIENISYDLYVRTPQFIVYKEQDNAKGLYNIVLPSSSDLVSILALTQSIIEELNINLTIDYYGTLSDYIEQRLEQDKMFTFITFILMAVSLSVLVSSFYQHISKILLLRASEFGTLRALGATKGSLLRRLLIESSIEWLIAVALNVIIIIILFNKIMDVFFVSPLAVGSLFIFSALSVLLMLKVLISSKVLTVFNVSPAQLIRIQ